MRNVYTFAGLTFALALAFSLTTAAQTSSTESKQPASPDQRQADSAGNMHRDRVGERLKWLSQQLNHSSEFKSEPRKIVPNRKQHDLTGLSLEVDPSLVWSWPTREFRPKIDFTLAVLVTANQPHHYERPSTLNALNRASNFAHAV